MLVKLSDRLMTVSIHYQVLVNSEASELVLKDLIRFLLLAIVVTIFFVVIINIFPVIVATVFTFHD